MGKKEEAAKRHGSGLSCSQAVYCAYHDVTGKSEQESAKIAAPYSGGRKVKCGAVLGAELVLQDLYGNDAADKIAELERIFTEKNQSVNCLELRGAAGGPKLRSCRGCVEDAAEILESILA
ncbi:MAG: C_GCAxxG_C_C family protein [Eubacterium sp.]|nr:C_GCAxxG_C_C family protein [Eubacterium sp.]